MRRLSAPDREALSAMQARRDWIWISGNHDPGAAVRSRLAWWRAKSRSARSISAMSRPVLWVKSPAICIPRRASPTRGRSMERRCFASDGERAVMPAFGAYTGGLSIRDSGVRENFPDARASWRMCFGDNRVHCYRGVTVLLRI
jgi:metallophosphoesterase superfamily enzyme